MRSQGVVVLAPLLEQYPGLFQREENLTIEQLISELAIESFIVSILLRTSAFDEESLHNDPFKPFPQGYSDKLWTIVGLYGARLGMEIGWFPF